jgi:hypothetical protein
MESAAHSLAKKLEEFGYTLDQKEQEVLNTILRLYAEAVEDRLTAIKTLTDEDKKELEPVNAALEDRKFDEDGNAMTTPCWTTITITTTVQTAHWLCNPRELKVSRS